MKSQTQMEDSYGYILKNKQVSDPHIIAVKNISSVFKKEWLTSYDYKKQNLPTIKVNQAPRISSQHRL